MTEIDDAFATVGRAQFLPPAQRPHADEDRPLPIGYGATNSQPSTVRYMLTRLDVRPGQRVLDVGCGSGWTTALLAHLVGPGGVVVGVDIVEELVVSARERLVRPGVSIELAAPGVLGWPEGAPYDRILVSADGGRVPAPLVSQLAVGGQMVLPAAGTMVVVDRDEDEVRLRPTGDAFRFVPLR